MRSQTRPTSGESHPWPPTPPHPPTSLSSLISLDCSLRRGARGWTYEMGSGAQKSQDWEEGRKDASVSAAVPSLSLDSQGGNTRVRCPVSCPGNPLL